MTAKLSGYMTLRVTGPGGEYRIIYKIVSGDFVKVVYLGPRENLYEAAFRVLKKNGIRVIDSIDDVRAYLAALDSESTLHEEPEGALPSTDGTLEEVDDPMSPAAILARQAALGSDDALDIAAAAEAFLAKTAVRTFTPKEQAELIDEGSDGRVASNLDQLQIQGTHYEGLGHGGDWNF